MEAVLRAWIHMDLVAHARFLQLLLIGRIRLVHSRILLGVQVKDITGGFNAFRAETLKKIDLESVESVGYCFQVDLTWKTLKAGLDVREVPITFVEREFGDSKMSGGIVFESIILVTKWGLRSRWRKLTGKA